MSFFFSQKISKKKALACCCCCSSIVHAWRPQQARRRRRRRRRVTTAAAAASMATGAADVVTKVGHTEICLSIITFNRFFAHLKQKYSCAQSPNACVCANVLHT